MAKPYYVKKCHKYDRVEGLRADPGLKKLMPAIKKRILDTDDNCTIVCFGATGSGKSTLAFHAAKAYNGGELVNIERVGFDAYSWAQALKTAQNDKGAFLIHDEANFSKRDSMAQKNKDFIDLLFTLRAKNWTIWLNNPSADYLDKQLITEDLVNFFVYIYAKQARYYVFNRKGMQRLMEEGGNLKPDTVKDLAKHFALYDGWFIRYVGDDWQEYLSKKEARMDDKLNQYIDKYGKGRTYTQQEVAAKLGVSPDTVRLWRDRLKHLEQFDTLIRFGKSWRYLEEHIELIRDAMTATQ